MPLRESKAKVLEQLILLLTFEMSLEDSCLDGDKAVLESEDFVFELVVKKKKGKLVLIKKED